jgi:hypothetical protein
MSHEFNILMGGPSSPIVIFRSMGVVLNNRHWYS